MGYYSVPAAALVCAACGPYGDVRAFGIALWIPGAWRPSFPMPSHWHAVLQRGCTYYPSCIKNKQTNKTLPSFANCLCQDSILCEALFPEGKHSVAATILLSCHFLVATQHLASPFLYLWLFGSVLMGGAEVLPLVSVNSMPCSSGETCRPPLLLLSAVPPWGVSGSGALPEHSSGCEKLERIALRGQGLYFPSAGHTVLQAPALL